MRHDKLENQLDLILLLTDGHAYTVSELCKKLNISQRSLYYYLDFFRMAGFHLVKSGYTYRIDRSSPFIKKLRQGVELSEDEAVLMRNLIEQAQGNNPMLKHLAHKLERFYDLKIFTDVKMQERTAANTRTLYEAIKTHSVVKIIDYSSPHSLTVSNRFVEPFHFMNDNHDIRCYEINTHMNKTFKIARMGKVELVNALWSHETLHKQSFTDAFMFSGEEQFHIVLKLGQLSCHLLQEEFPQAVASLTKNADGTGTLNIEVSSYVGIGRFVLGLLADIEVVEGEGFKQYLKEKVQQMAQKLQA